MRNILLGTGWVILGFVLTPFFGQYCLAREFGWLCIAARALLVPLVLTPLLIWVGHHFRLLDKPDSRKNHTVPTPRLGGVGIFVSFYVFAMHFWHFDQTLLGIVLGSTIMFVLGLADDIRGLSATLKLIGQIAAAGVVAACGVTITFVPNSWPGAIALEYVITVIWLIGIANAINFLDGIDGLAASFGIVCGCFFFALALVSYQPMVAYVSILVAAACAGFLPYNFQFWKRTGRAAIFLGDSGSTLIGFVLAAVAVRGSWASNDPLVALSTPLLILSVAIFDMIYITISRVRRGVVRSVKEWIEYVGRDHLHHRLLKIGLSGRGTVYFIGLINLIMGLSALVIPSAGVTGAILLLGQAVCIFFVLVILMVAGRELTR